MRVVETAEYPETRDAISQDWGRFISAAMPDAIWVPIPNTPESCISHFDAFGLTGLILTGGGDIRESTVRNETENRLIEHCTRNKIPMLGICRGMQMLHTHFGGALSKCEPDAHVGTRHRVRIIRPITYSSGTLEVDSTVEVNSFHRWSINVAEMTSTFSLLAQSDDEAVEAFVAKDFSAIGVMWHPERERAPTRVDRAIIDKLFYAQ